MICNLAEKIKNWFRRQFWWRFEFRKVKTKYRNWERCYECHASFDSGGFPGQKFCNEESHLCPCKENEKLVFKL